MWWYLERKTHYEWNFGTKFSIFRWHCYTAQIVLRKPISTLACNKAFTRLCMLFIRLIIISYMLNWVHIWKTRWLLHSFIFIVISFLSSYYDKNLYQSRFSPKCDPTQNHDTMYQNIATANHCFCIPSSTNSNSTAIIHQYLYSFNPT